MSASRAALGVLAGVYLAGVWLDGVGSTLPSTVLPRVANYFLQVAALFPVAATMTIDYRAEAWVCGDRKWEELDTKPYFPLDPDDKENRFQRVMHFYRASHEVMRALDDYIVERHPSVRGDDGIDPLKTLGGIRVMSLRIPLPDPGEALHRFRREPLEAYPEKERHHFYHTTRSRAAARCGTTPDSITLPEPGASSEGSRPPEPASSSDEAERSEGEREGQR